LPPQQQRNKHNPRQTAKAISIILIYCWLSNLESFWWCTGPLLLDCWKLEEHTKIYQQKLVLLK